MRARAAALALTATLALLPPPGASAGQPASSETAPTLAQTRDLLARGLYADAERAARAAIGALESSGATDSPATADLLDLLVTALVKGARDRGGDAKHVAERALALRVRLHGRDHPETTPSMMALADVLRHNGEFPAAGPLYQGALVIREQAFGPESLETAESAQGLGNLLYDTGDYAGAKPQYERALAIRTRGLGPERLEVADTMFNLSAVARNTGDWEGSRRLLERVLEIRERALGADHPAVASVLNNLALTLKQGGDFPAARHCYERALAIWERTYGPEHPYVAGVLNNLASLAIRMGDRHAARALLEHSLAIREKALGPSHPEVAQCLSNLAMVLNDTGDRATARGLLERSLAIRVKALGPAHRDVATTLVNLGEVLLAAGDATAARATHERALAIREAALGPDHPAVAESLHAVAAVLGQLGEIAAARHAAERALAIWTKAFGPRHPAVAQASLTIARLLACAGDQQGALTAALRAEEIGREHLRLTAHLLAEREALRYATIRANGRDLAVSLMIAGAATADQRTRVWESVAASRSVVFDAIADRRRIARSAQAPDVAPLVEEFVRATEELASILVRNGGEENPDRGRALLTAARERAELAERTLAERSAAFATSRAGVRPGAAAVASALPAGGALVSFVRYRHDPAAGPPPWPALPRGDRTPACAGAGAEFAYAALVVGAGDADVTVVSLGAAQEVEELIERWVFEASRGAGVTGRTPAAALTACREAGRALRRRVWDPLAPHLRNTRIALLVPEGALHLVNWAALPLGRSSYLVETLPILHLLTCERDLTLADPAPRPGEGLLALGGAAFDSASALALPGAAANLTGTATPPGREGVQLRSTTPCAALLTARFEPLPGAALEVDEIAALWRAEARRRPAAGRTPVRERRSAPDETILLTGEAANEAAFKAASRGRRVLHLATHGFFLGGRCDDGVPGARGIGGLAASRPPDSGDEGPRTISGLALAGANQRQTATPAQQDGILIGEEIATLDLQGTEWAVLSACDTGIGEVHASEGVLGLQRCFRTAGVRTVIMSLWAVDDAAAREWMAALYGARLGRRFPTAEAVRAASLAVLASRRSHSRSSHPSSWGAFVATGDWR